jgi:hypothetical protein
VTKRYGDVTHKSWVIDFEKLQAVCDVSGFMDQQPEADD